MGFHDTIFSKPAIPLRTGRKAQPVSINVAKGQPGKTRAEKPDLPEAMLDKIYDSLCQTADILDKSGVKWFLGHGAALGGARGKDLLKHDRDIDFIIPGLDKKEEITELIKQAKIYESSYSRNDGHVRLVCSHSMYEAFSLKNCLYFYEKIDDNFYAAKVKPVLSEEARFYLPARFFEKQDYVQIRDRQFPTFSPVHKYLEWLYGDWQTVNKQYNFLNFSTKHARSKSVAERALVELNNGKKLYRDDIYKPVFRTIADLDRTVTDNLHKIPQDIDLIVGIPRSGMLLANIICQYLNRPLQTLPEWLANKKPMTGRFRPPTGTRYNKVLIVDDAIGVGKTFRDLIHQIRGRKEKIITLAAYANEQTQSCCDITLEAYPSQRAWTGWSWNIFHHRYRKMMWDLDGVISVDAPRAESHRDKHYLNHINNAAVLIAPSFPVDICTGRNAELEAETKAWLKKNNIKYHNLYMRPPELRGQEAVAKHKAEHFKRSAREIFIESCPVQSKRIAELSGKPVYCITGQYFG